MKKEELEKYRQAAQDGSLPDEQNPLFLYSLTHTDLLVRIAAGELNVRALAREELTNRGLDENGIWVGLRKKEQNKPKAAIRARPGKRKGRSL